MKREREDVYTEPQRRKRPQVSSRGETNGTIKGGLTTSDALHYLKAVKCTFHDNVEKYQTFLEIMKDFKAHRVDTNGLIKRIKDLFKGYNDLILGLNIFLPKDYTINLPLEEEKRKTMVGFKDAIGFVTKMKARFGDDEHAYKRFLEKMNLYRKERKSIAEVYEEGHEDAASRRDALPCRKGSAMQPRHPDKKIKRRCKLEDDFEQSDQREDGDENLVAYSAGNSLGDSLVKDGQRGYLNVEDDGGTQDHENREDSERDTNRTDKNAAFRSQDIGNHKSPLSATNYVATPIKELDLSECTQCTPSYRLLPKDYPVEISRYRDTLGKKTLNDHLVSRSENDSFSHMRKNQYEESLFQCEDDRYEMDMLVESVNSAIKHVEILLEKINNNTISIDTTICIEKHFTAMNLRCIERLYDDNGLDVMDLLKNNLHSALPVILTRLKQKKEEWARCNSDFQKVWTEVYAKNHHKSLDHRSFVSTSSSKTRRT